MIRDSSPFRLAVVLTPLLVLATVAGAVPPPGSAVTGGDAPVEDVHHARNLACVTSGLPPDLGCPAWKHRYDGPGAYHDVPRAMATSPDGSLVVVTASSDAERDEEGQWWPDFATMAFDTRTGERLWLQREDADWGKSDDPRAVAFSPDGERVFVVGDSLERYEWDDMLAVAYDARTGDVLWRMRVPDTQWVNEYAGLSVSPDGGTLHIGFTERQMLDPGVTVIALDAGTGVTRWRATHVVDEIADLPTMGMALHPDGSRITVAAVVRAWSVFEKDELLVVTFDTASADVAWAREVEDGADRFPATPAVAVLADGSRVAVAGQGVLGFDAVNGSHVWTVSTVVVGGVVADPVDPVFYVTRWNEWTGGVEHFAMDADGARLWTHASNGGLALGRGPISTGIAANATAVAVVGTSTSFGAGAGAARTNVEVTVLDSGTGAVDWRLVDDSTHRDFGEAVALPEGAGRVIALSSAYDFCIPEPGVAGCPADAVVTAWSTHRLLDGPWHAAWATLP